MSVRQDRYTFFGVLAAVVIVVLGYLQLGRMYPLTGREDVAADQVPEEESGSDETGLAPREGEAQP
ncbi:MAG: hypothetical protein KTR15_08220 [Phycisphaeraceae bacterium]|nr:hypothetical protein [Phycisphaeraceae bacterium]